MAGALAELRREREQLERQVADLRSQQSARTTATRNDETNSNSSQPLTRDVQFTAVTPETAPVETWNTLLFYAHVESAIETVRTDAGTFEAAMGGAQRSLQVQSSRPLTRGVELMIVPECGGVTFEPEYLPLKWLKDMQRREFSFSGEQRLAGTTRDCSITVYVGPLIVATLRIPLSFSAQTQTQGSRSPQRSFKGVEASTSLYRRIFASYSYDDEDVVLACRNAYKALGDTVLIDRDTLKSGQIFDRALKAMIEEADVFQLFWSEHAAESQPVHEEWEYALNQNKGEGFIRPVYWQKPLAAIPPELRKIWFAYMPLPVLGQANNPPPDPAAGRNFWSRLFGRGKLRTHE